MGEAIKNKTWNEQSNVALKAEIAGLNENDLKKLQQKELEEWKKYIYDNPTYIYRVNKKGKSVPKKQKNTIDTMLKKQAEKANDQQKQKENNDMEQNKDKNMKPKPKKKQNKKKNKKPTKKQLLPLMPE